MKICALNKFADFFPFEYNTQYMQRAISNKETEDYKVIICRL